MPRQSDPVVRVLLDHVFDTSQLQDAASYGVKDVVVFVSWTKAAERIGNTYFRAGSISVTNPDARVRLGDRNVVRFASEIGRSLDAVLRLATLIADVTSAALANESDEERYNQLIRGTGWFDTQYKLSTTIKRTLCCLVIDDLPRGWVHERIAVLAEVAPRVVRHLDDSDVGFVRAFAKAAFSGLKDATGKEALAAIGAFHQD